jgi:hypothetical protein
MTSTAQALEHEGSGRPVTGPYALPARSAGRGWCSVLAFSS